MKPFLKYALTAVIIAGLGTVFYNKVYIPKTTFTTLSPKLGNLEVTIQGIGNVNAKDIYSITAQTGGKILSIKTDEGKWVKKGDLLIEMDGVDLPKQLEVMQATLQKAEYDIKASEDELNNQKSQKRLLEITYNRYKKLKAQKFASQAEYDKAKADLDSINASISATIARIGSARAALKIAEKNVDVIKAKIARLKVFAPVDGYVISKDAEVAQNVLPSTPVLKIVDAKTLWVETKIDERISSKVKVGQSASITLRSQPNKVFKGIVKRISAMSDAVTLEREIDVAFVEIPEPFYINEQAEVKVAIERFTNVVKIPSTVVVQQGGVLGVWVAKDLKAKFIKLDKIAQNDDAVAVKNIPTSTKIIVPDAHKKPLKDGMKIQL